MASPGIGRLWLATFALLVASVAVNVAQANRLRTVISPRKPSALLGRTVKPISVVETGGRAAVIRFDRNVPTLLYYFSPTCAWCERNWDNVREIARVADGRYRVIALASETALSEFAMSHEFQFEIYGGVTNDVRETLGLSGTPRTIVVSAQGIITHDWTGAYSGPVGVAVESLFGLDLPGVRPAAPSRAGQR